MDATQITPMTIESGILDIYDGLNSLDPFNPNSKGSDFSADGYVTTYKATDLKLSKLFALLFEDALVYVADTKRWMYYDGTKWNVDEGASIVQQCIDKFIRALCMYVSDSTWMTREEQTANLKAMDRYQAQSRRASLIIDCQDEQKLVKYRRDFDKSDRLFNCPSFTLSLSSPIRIEPHHPKNYLTKVAGCDVRTKTNDKGVNVPDNNIDNSPWLTFLNEIMEGDTSKVEYLQRIAGYGMTASTVEDKLFILYGKTTRNGKSTFINTVAKAFGDYATTAKPELLQVTKRDAGRATPELAKLDGVRTLVLSEPPENMILDVALAKTLTGGDDIAVRHLHQEEFNLHPKFKAYINTNHELRVLDETLFSSNRVQVIEFNRHFDEAEQDKHLEEKLQSRKILEDVLLWALIGLQEYTSRDSLDPPKAVIAANEAYRNSMSKIGLFIDDVLVKVEGERAVKVGVPLSDLFRTYKAWCTEQGYGVESRGKFRSRFLGSDKCTIVSNMKVNGVSKRDVLIGYQMRELNDRNGD